MFSILDRYILRQVATPLLASLSIGLLMLLADRMVRVLERTLGKKSSFLSAFELMAYLVPHYLGTAVPAALFLGLLFGFNKLSKSSELDAMLASGISYHRMMRPVMLLALIFSLLALGMFGWLQPYARYAYRSALFDIVNVDAFFLAEEGVFMQAGSRTFILDKLDRENSRFERIFLFDDRGPKGAETLTASEGVLIAVPGQTRPVLRLENGHQLDLDKWPTANLAVPPRVGTFETTETPLGNVSKDLFRPRGGDHRELTIVELYQQIDTPPQDVTRDAMRAAFHNRLVNIVIMLVLPFLALPFAVGRVRSPRAYRITIAMVLLVAFHELIGQGQRLTASSDISPWLTLWLPTFLLTAFAFWRFYKMSFTLTENAMDRFLTPIHDAVSGLLRRLWRRPA